MRKITLFLSLLISTFAFSQVGVSENFDSGTPAGWTDSYANTTSQTCAGNSERDNLYSGSSTGNITTPNYVGGSNGTDLTVSFDYKIVDWSAATVATSAGWGTAELQYSTDDGGNWTTVLTINDGNHVVANTCANMMAVIPAASLPNGSDVKLQIATTWASGDYYFYVDNFEANQVATTPPNCDATVANITPAGDISWSAATGIPTGYRITAGTTSGGTDLANNVDAGNVLTYNVGALTIGSTYYVTITPYNGNGDATGCTEQTFTIPCLDPTGAGTSNIMPTSADLDWTENNGSMSWNIEWGLDGFTQGTGTVVAVTTNPYTLMGLTDNTAYDYYVQTDCGGATSMWVGPISFTTAALPPANDNFANAQALNCGDNVTGSTSAATLDEDDAPDGFGADMDAPNVWFSYTGSGSLEDVTIDLCPSSYDTSILVYTGTSGNLTLVGGNDDNATECGSQGGNTRSYATFSSDGTTTYYIAVEGWNSTSTGNFDLTITCASACTPAQMNQDCASATAAAVDGMAFTVDNTCATVNATQPTCDTFSSIADVWYTFVAPAGGEVDIASTLGTATAAHMAVYSGACGTLTQEGCSSAATGSLSLTGLTEGDTYYLQLWNNGSEEGTFDVTISDATLSVESAEVRGFTHYVDTVNNNFVVNAQSNIGSIEVYNLVGQVIATAKPNSTAGIADLGTIKNGVYFARVTLDNGRTSIVKFAK